MGVQFEPIGQSLEQYGPWHFGDPRFREDGCAGLEAALLQTANISGLSDRLLGISKGARADNGPARPEVTLSVSKVRLKPRNSPGSALSEESTPATTTNTSPSLFPSVLHPSLAFQQLEPSGKTVVTFPLPEPTSPPKRCLKRRRPDTDVDGPGTFSISHKKRRLLHHLITSRLSQPFSLPATHILNREAVATGGKRFAKLTAIMAARRLNSTVVPPVSPQQPNPSTWLRRAAVLNRLRNRVYATAAERANNPVPDFTAKAAVFQQSQGPATAYVGGRYLIAGPIHSTNRILPVMHGPTAIATVTATQRPPPAATAAAAAHHHYQHHHPPSTTRLRIPSPKLRPLRSPELRVTRPLVPLEDIEPLLVDDPSSFSGDTDCVAFPTAELEGRYIYGDDDEDEEGVGEGEGGVGVYADFSVIFGGGGNSGDDEGEGNKKRGGRGDCEEGDVDCFEDYMDDLDGIPWGGSW
ncbi:hypothetical protein P885DRAFT_62117 [Corynascus similis CBS 632.67]